jgi:hypothetical protein
LLAECGGSTPAQTIAIEERMDGLELRLRDRRLGFVSSPG